LKELESQLKAIYSQDLSDFVSDEVKKEVVSLEEKKQILLKGREYAWRLKI
jgi:hypothetical protein